MAFSVGCTHSCGSRSLPVCEWTPDWQEGRGKPGFLEPDHSTSAWWGAAWIPHPFPLLIENLSYLGNSGWYGVLSSRSSGAVWVCLCVYTTQQTPAPSTKQELTLRESYCQLVQSRFTHSLSELGGDKDSHPSAYGVITW